ncbi:MAG: helix-turn-helix transcriptional regulator [Burkholderiales bacterium]|nr:helix-turn-helix transcriptional regulator [Burkholderiales bacterium]
MSTQVNATYRFGRFQMDPAQRRLLVDGRAVALGQRAFDLLLTLVERRDRLVPKRELFDVVWPGLVVEENNLQVQVSALRKLIGNQAIETVPGRGYRFRAALEGAATAPAPAATRPAPSDLFGRVEDLAALCALLETHRLVTVVGAGGIGKSRLALAAAHTLSGRSPEVRIVEFAGLSEPTLVGKAIAQALDVKASDASLGTALAARRALVILDNCEHLLNAIAPLVEVILQAAPDVTLLATSQEPLRLPQEQRYRLMPLAVPTGSESDARAFGAVALFAARVRASDPRFALGDENLALAIDICRQLDGLPLAIELAAARAATLGLRAVRDKLDARFKLLTGGSRATLRRHQTLRAALEWSHHLLGADERTVFRRLGAFAGGFTVELAQAVAADAALDEWQVLDTLSSLVDKSLVSMDPGDPPRYRLLESARAFALEQLAQGDADATLRRHANAMRDFLVRIDDANMDGHLRTDQYAARVLPELDNLRAAFTWADGDGGDAHTAVALAAHAGSLIDHSIECIDWLLAVDRHVDDALPPPLAARYFRALAASNMTRRVTNARQVEAGTRAAAYYRAHDHPRRLFSTLMRLCLYQREAGDGTAADATQEEARALLRPDWPVEYHAMMLRRDANEACIAGRYAEAVPLSREAVRLCASAGDWRLEVMCRIQLADMLWAMGTLQKALTEARALAQSLRERPVPPADMDMHFTNLLGMESEFGNVAEAAAAAHEALPLILRTGSRYYEEWVHFFWRRGQHDVAARLCGQCDARRKEYMVQVNERRLLEQARAGLAAAMDAPTLAARLSAGAALSDAEAIAAVAQALGEPPATPRAG